MQSTSLSIFLREIEHCGYGEKFRRWQEYLHKVSQSDEYLQALSTFLDCFPFNLSYWLEYIHCTGEDLYQQALARNPKSYELWANYLALLKNNAPLAKYKKELEKAIMEVGADTRCLWLYEEYYAMISQSFHYEFYKKVFTRALIGLEALFAKFELWFAALSDEQIRGIHTKETKTVETDLALQRSFLYEQVASIYRRTLPYREERMKLQATITHFYFNGQGEGEREIWDRLVQLERGNGVIENISYCYERSLMAQADDVDRWQEAFHYLQNETNKYSKVLSILRSNKKFFMQFSLKLYFYWCDMEERENAATARKMYAELAEGGLWGKATLEVYEKYLQFEIREKQWANAKGIFDTMLAVFQEDHAALSYILVEYCEFVIKYYKDFEYSKKLLKTYFDLLPYNEYLFTNYLEFMKNFENKEGYYDELMLLIQDALVKAKKGLNEKDLAAAIKMVKYYLRSTLSSIYLIKVSQRRMMDFEEKIKDL